MEIRSELPSLMAESQVRSDSLRVHMDDSLAAFNLSTHLIELLRKQPHKSAPAILCIGTDRSTGDCLGPLTGWRLKTLLHNMNIDIYGTVDQPVHAQNLTQNMNSLKALNPHKPIIAIDACLGRYSNVGTILLEPEPLKPGAGVAKELPAVGDISIVGIVNVGGFMELQILQNTRLSTVLKMSQIIANSIFFALRKAY